MFQHLSDTWLRRLHGAYIAVTALMVCCYVVARLAHVDPSTMQWWALTAPVIAICSLHCLYGLVYPLFSKLSVWQASIVSQAVFSIMLSAAIAASHDGNLVIRIAWIAVAGVSVINGLIVGVIEIAFDWLITLFSIIGVVAASPLGNLNEVILSVCVALSVVTAYIVLRPFYEADPEEQLQAVTEVAQRAALQANVVLRSIADGVIIVDSSLRVTAINPAAAGITGEEQGRGVGRDVRSILQVRPLDEAADRHDIDLFAGVLSDWQPASRTVRVISRADRRVVVSLALSPIVVPPGRLLGIVAIIRDITKAHDIERRRKVFIDAASHEMRSPVATIAGYLELALADDSAGLDEKRKAYLEEASTSTAHLSRLLQDLLSVLSDEEAPEESGQMSAVDSGHAAGTRGPSVATHD